MKEVEFLMLIGSPGSGQIWIGETLARRIYARRDLRSVREEPS